MKITAEDMMRLGVIDGIIREPVGGAHRDPKAVDPGGRRRRRGGLCGTARPGPRGDPARPAEQIPRDRPDPA